jgi:hypothetical protein
MTTEFGQAIERAQEGSLKLASGLAIKSVTESDVERKASFMRMYSEMAAFSDALRRWGEGHITLDEISDEAGINTLGHYQAIRGTEART